jgi:hypothetical protein
VIERAPPTPEEWETVTVLSYVAALQAYRERTLASLRDAIAAFGTCGCGHRGHIGRCLGGGRGRSSKGKRRGRSCRCRMYWRDDGSTGETP